MTDNNPEKRTTRAGWSALLFFIAGALLIIFTVILGTVAFTDFDVREVRSVFGPGGFAFAFGALLLLYPSLAERVPWPARAGAFFGLSGLVGSTLVSLTTLAEVTGIFKAPGWTSALDLLIIIGLIPGFLSFAVAVLRTELYPQTLGYLLIGPAAIFALNFVRGVTLGRWTPIWSPFLLGAAQALVHMAIGLVLRKEAVEEHTASKAPELHTA